METTRWMGELWYIRTVGRYLSVRGKSYPATKGREGTLTACCLVKDFSPKRLHTMWFQLFVILEKTTGAGSQGWRGGASGTFRAVKLFCSLWYCSGGRTTFCVCQNPWDIRTVDPDVNYGLYLLILHQYWFINSKKCATLMQDVNNGEQWGARREYTGTLNFLLSFFYGPKIV